MSAALVPKTGEDAPKLNERQRAFADLWIKAKTEGLPLTHAEIAKAAGYKGGTDLALYVQANDCLKHPAVRSYLQQQAKQILLDGGVGAAATLAALSTRATSERVRADTAYRLAVGTGLLAPEGQAGGAGITISFVFPGGAGNALASAAAPMPQVIDAQREASVTHSLPEGAAGVKRGRRASGEPPRPPSKAAGEGAGVKNRARRSPPGSTHDFPSESRGVGKVGGRKVGRKNSGSGKSRGGR